MTRAEECRKWASIAEDDFEMIESCLGTRRCAWNLVVFHAQQGIEKDLKSFLVLHSVEFRRTHDLQELLKSAGSAAPELLQFADDATALNPFASVERYGFEKLPESVAVDLIAAANRIRSAIRALLP